jgi:hypothetical protein
MNSLQHRSCLTQQSSRGGKYFALEEMMASSFRSMSVRVFTSASMDDTID